MNQNKEAKAAAAGQQQHSSASAPLSAMPLASQQQTAHTLPSGMVPAPGCAPTALPAHSIAVSVPQSTPSVLAPPAPSHRSLTPFGSGPDDLSGLGRHSSLPVSSGLPVEGGVLGGAPNAALPAPGAYAATSLTPSGAPVLMKRNNGMASQNRGAEALYGPSALNVGDQSLPLVSRKPLCSSFTLLSLSLALTDTH